MDVSEITTFVYSLLRKRMTSECKEFLQDCLVMHFIQNQEHFNILQGIILKKENKK